MVATSGKIHAEVVRAVGGRQVQDWARVVAEAKGRGWAKGEIAPRLPGVDWSFGLGESDDRMSDEWWASAVAQQPLVMRTSHQFYGALRRYVLPH